MLFLVLNPTVSLSWPMAIDSLHVFFIRESLCLHIVRLFWLDSGADAISKGRYTNAFPKQSQKSCSMDFARVLVKLQGSVVIRGEKVKSDFHLVIWFGLSQSVVSWCGRKWKMGNYERRFEHEAWSERQERKKGGTPKIKEEVHTSFSLSLTFYTFVSSARGRVSSRRSREMY